MNAAMLNQEFQGTGISHDSLLYYLDALGRREILDLIQKEALTVHFQPIIASGTGTVFGFEALMRIDGMNPFGSVSEVFGKARTTNTISLLDMKCRENAIRESALQGIKEKGAHLFINICPETLMDPSHKIGLTDKLVERWGVPKEKIILEITEETAIYNYELFRQSIAYYKNRGYKIAIDDFGAGYGGLKMLSAIEPDFIKIDRHFISAIDRNRLNRTLVDSIATACHRLGIKVIAEGVEQKNELEAILSLGIKLLQGYYLCSPARELTRAGEVLLTPNVKTGCTVKDGFTVGDIVSDVTPLSPDASLTEALSRFINEPGLRGLPIVEENRVAGMLFRSVFLENQVLGSHGYAVHLNSHKTVGQIMAQDPLLVEANLSLEEAALKIHLRKSEFPDDAICVTSHGNYLGTVAISALLDAITEQNLLLARDSNPLTGLPGNAFIQREIEKRLSQRSAFDICYIDIDHFKPYNDHYGFERGDFVIKNLALMIQQAVSQSCSDSDFIGHIGGDDFVILSHPERSGPITEKVVASFTGALREFHGEEACETGNYRAMNRKGDMDHFDLLSISIGIVGAAAHTIQSYGQLASLATEVKKAAKLRQGSSIVRNQRLSAPVSVDQ